MIRGPKFWISMTVFQVVFALIIFLVTRQYYINDSQIMDIVPSANNQPEFVWPDSVNQNSSAVLDSSTFKQSTSGSPMEILRQATESFANRQYDSAAKLYQRLLNFDPENVDTYNNLGITLHYLGRSTEALRWLNEGVALDPTHQRIRLTTGFVYNQLGSIDQARSALVTAIEIEADNDIGQSAAKMLESLP